MQDLKPDHISVCICTFHRPELLSKALAGVTRQVTESSFTFEVVVVDNDQRRSAEDAVRLFQPGNATNIIYACEPEQNIALARNRASMAFFIIFVNLARKTSLWRLEISKYCSII